MATVAGQQFDGEVADQVGLLQAGSTSEGSHGMGELVPVAYSLRSSLAECLEGGMECPVEGETGGLLGFGQVERQGRGRSRAADTSGQAAF